MAILACDGGPAARPDPLDTTPTEVKKAMEGLPKITPGEQRSPASCDAWKQTAQTRAAGMVPRKGELSNKAVVGAMEESCGEKPAPPPAYIPAERAPSGGRGKEDM